MVVLKSVSAKWLVMVSAMLAPAVGAELSDEKLRQLFERVRPLPTESQAGNASARAAAELTAERLKERSDLLAQGELDLSNLRVDEAQQAFEKAALILHAADSEMALVRSYMQAGEYRRALAFGAHTAGAHLDVVGGAALYAWLLYIGGQHTAARQLLNDAAARTPDNTLIQSVQRQLASGSLSASNDMLAPPTRLAPYASSSGLSGRARVISSATLLPGAAPASGGFALVPLAALEAKPAVAAATNTRGEPALWLRNALGQLSRATLEKQLPSLGVAVLRLAVPLPLPEGLPLAAGNPFAGSAGYTVQYPAAQAGQPLELAWPQLHIGFVGGMATPDNPASDARLLGISLPAGPRGGGLFNASGQFAGLTLQAANGLPDLLVTLSQLRQALGSSAALYGLAQVTEPVATPSSADKIYEASLKNTLQVISD